MSKTKLNLEQVKSELVLGDVDNYYQSELKRVVNNEKLMKELSRRGIDASMIDGNLGNILDFESSHLECEAYHHEHGPRPCGTQIVELIAREGKVTRLLTACPHQIDLDQKALRYRIKDFPNDWLFNRLANVDVQRNRAPLLQELLAMVKGEKPWIYAYGKSGRGKAFMAVSALNEIIALNPSTTIAFVDFPKFISENMVDYFNNRANVDNLVTLLSTVDYLVLNKFGNEELSDLVKGAITMPVISNRDANGKVTIFLSSLSLEELEGLHTSSKNNQIRAKQMLDIIRDNIKKPIHLQGAKLY